MTRVAILGSGNIGTDLMVKVLRSDVLEMGVLVGVDPTSDGLARAARLGVATVATGLDGLLAGDLPGGLDGIGVVFDATSAGAHAAHTAALAGTGVRMVDLTPAATGPFVVPPVNLTEHLDAPEVNMVTCGGQATVPIVAAVARVAPVAYAEIVAAIASRSAGPGTRANIDEFTETTAAALERVGGARRGKAIIVLNPADPPMIMRDTVHCLVEDGDPERVRESVEEMVAAVAAYVPGYRLAQRVQVLPGVDAGPLVPGGGTFTQVSVFLEVTGAADHLPAYAGNLDIMTSAARRVGERMATRTVVAA